MRFFFKKAPNGSYFSSFQIVPQGKLNRQSRQKPTYRGDMWWWFKKRPRYFADKVHDKMKMYLLQTWAGASLKQTWKWLGDWQGNRANIQGWNLCYVIFNNDIQHTHMCSAKACAFRISYIHILYEVGKTKSVSVESVVEGEKRYLKLCFAFRPHARVSSRNGREMALCGNRAKSAPSTLLRRQATLRGTVAAHSCLENRQKSTENARKTCHTWLFSQFCGIMEQNVKGDAAVSH